MRLPTLFISHGSPMHAIDAGAAGEVWAALGQATAPPRAVLMITAHWETNIPMLSGNAKPGMIYDFGGFPDALYQIRYPAIGAPEIAQRAATLLRESGLTAAVDGCRGLDHGTWVPLLRLFPDATIPVVQLSVQPTLGVAHAYRVGAALMPLRDEGVLIIGSGHLTHNLRDWMVHARTPTLSTCDYVSAFQDWMWDKLQANDVDALIHYRERAPLVAEATRAHPTEEHLLPLFVAHAAAGAMGGHPVATRVFDQIEGGALAMDAYRFT
jgi:4,5-DOPA dioxygenase extradiol